MSPGPRWNWRYTANRWPTGKRREDVSFTVHRILATIAEDAERWAAMEDAPFNQRTAWRQWTPDAAKRLVGQRVDRPVTVEEKVAAVTDLTRDEEVAALVATDLLRRPAVAEQVAPDQKLRMVAELTRDERVAREVTRDLLRRPSVAREAMRDDTARTVVNRAQFDNSEAARERIRERVPAVRKIAYGRVPGPARLVSPVRRHARPAGSAAARAGVQRRRARSRSPRHHEGPFGGGLA